MISFKNFSFKYNNVVDKTLKDINITIDKGEKVLMVGPSGSGKSTLSHCLNGLIPFSYNGEMEGSVIVDNIKPYEESLSDISKKIGTIMQDQDSQFVGLSVGEDVAFSFENDAIPVNEMKVKVIDALELVNMVDFINRSPHELSGGQKQRVSLAGVLGSDAEVLLFDEPLANLDPASGKEIMQLINDIHKRTNKTIIIVEHRIEDVLDQLFDKVIIIDKGKVKAIGTPDDILKSNLLEKSGLREPLYVSAMKYANCNFKKINKLTDFKKLDEESKENIKNWFKNNSKNTSIKDNNNEEKILEINNLAFSHNKNKNTLENISFNLSKGEILAILGNNGAGKSTLCRLITGILKYKDGSVFLKNKCIDSWSIKKRSSSIGYVMQNPNQMISQHMIKDEIGLGLKCRGYSKEEIDIKVEEVLKICGLYPYRNWPIGALSYGQKKRVTIASILAINPDVIILDEPTAGQDHKHYTEFMEFIKSLANKGISIILITHDMQLTLEYCDRAVVLSNGKKIADNKPSYILTDENIIKQANLKETSLSTLAKAVNIKNTNDFVQFFIDYERQVKGNE
ncbi:ABC transporter ATP-binding protein [Terrisporobacter mayombei]|uniref:HMP/thiamine import ATP-binding protein YkoD n=1 Tax=Terrisporobacter mayombei TaxID=1541 RepID=A0ABY9Q7C9_9FIRM|nr:ABC transporter ATP-binding protein [Terrisporobacter mayombei]MCC3869600.1 ABC transporter ATP-binding protein [Terrisporobacter mayombei]WMT83461.1 Putative HMP/thiamine import ATP-binding protein YkoD [Terrisporobacter mayombei]